MGRLHRHSVRAGGGRTPLDDLVGQPWPVARPGSQQVPRGQTGPVDTAECGWWLEGPPFQRGVNGGDWACLGRAASLALNNDGMALALSATGRWVATITKCGVIGLPDVIQGATLE